MESIKSNIDDFLNLLNSLIDLKDKIIQDCNKYFGATDISFEEIKQNWNNVDNSNLVLMNSQSFRNSFDNDYISYFDYVYVVDNENLTDEDKLQLFLISKNKLSYLQLLD